MKKYIISNNRIRARKVRLIDEDGKQIGIFDLKDALQKSIDAGLDLIQISEKTDPPICKIMQYGKYAYSLGKKEKQKKQKAGEIKNVRLTYNISKHDMETRAKFAKKFLDKNNKVKIEMPLRGRQKALGEFAKQKLAQFVEILKQEIQIKIERELKREPRGFTMIISKI